MNLNRWLADRSGGCHLGAPISSTSASLSVTASSNASASAGFAPYPLQAVVRGSNGVYERLSLVNS